MIIFLIIVLVTALIAVIVGSVFGASIRVMLFPGILIGSSNDIHEYSFKDEDGEMHNMKINQLQFCLICVAISLIWEID